MLNYEQLSENKTVFFKIQVMSLGDNRALTYHIIS